jgi:UDP-N-acetylglucosamine transferase subunit ALG13
MRILLVCSSGGYLLQLHNLKPWRERHDGMRVTFEKLDSKSLLAGESVTWAHHPTTRNPRALAQDFTLAWRLPRSTSLTSSSPAAPGWPTVLPAGSAARADGGVRGGLRPHRLGHQDRSACYPFSICSYSNGRSSVASIPGRRHRRVAVRSGNARPVVLVSVGTNHHPFDWLVRWVDGWLDAVGGPGAPLRYRMHNGTSPPSSGAADWQPYPAFEALQAAMREAAAVVCHGGPSAILGARHVGAVPIVVPRRQGLGEHVDDHQVAFCRRLADEGGVFLAETEADLYALLDRVATDPAAFHDPFEHRHGRVRPRAAGRRRACRTPTQPPSRGSGQTRGVPSEPWPGSGPAGRSRSIGASAAPAWPWPSALDWCGHDRHPPRPRRPHGHLSTGS